MRTVRFFTSKNARKHWSPCCLLRWANIVLCPSSLWYKTLCISLLLFTSDHQPHDSFDNLWVDLTAEQKQCSLFDLELWVIQYGDIPVNWHLVWLEYVEGHAVRALCLSFVYTKSKVFSLCSNCDYSKEQEQLCHLFIRCFCSFFQSPGVQASSSLALSVMSENLSSRDTIGKLGR